MHRLLIIWLGKLIIVLGRLFGHAGSALPGLVAQSLYVGFISSMAKQLPKSSVLVTGTNGKTTTTKMLRQILSDGGLKVLTNRAGSNMSRGVAAAFIEQADWLGRLEADIALFEVDEAFVPEISAKLKPRLVVVLNLLRDQLDRYGELDRTAALIKDGLSHAKTAVLNIDDPLVWGMSDVISKPNVTAFGAAKALRDQLPHDHALHARAKLSAVKQRPQLFLNKAKDSGSGQIFSYKHRGRQYSVRLALPGIYNAYNALAALAAAKVLGVAEKSAGRSLEKVLPAFGRAEMVEVGGKKLRLLLVKNPAGFNQVIKTFLLKPNIKCLIAINDNIADGRDVSWLWDVDFEAFEGAKPKLSACGIRGSDLALRLKYVDVKVNFENDLHQAVDQFIGILNKREVGYIVPTYTAMLEIRKYLKTKSKLGEVWE